jgi:hypothetical protein
MMIIFWLFLICCILLAFEGGGSYSVNNFPGEHYRADGSKIYREGEQ